MSDMLVAILNKQNSIDIRTILICMNLALGNYCENKRALVLPFRHLGFQLLQTTIAILQGDNYIAKATLKYVADFITSSLIFLVKQGYLQFSF